MPAGRGPTLLAIAVAAPWALWAVVRVGGLDFGHPLAAAMAFTPYAALSAPLPVLAALLLRRRLVALGAAVAAVALAAVVLPRAFDGPRGRPSSGVRMRLTVMTFNMRYGQGDAETVARLVRRHGVAVLSLQELTAAGVARLDAAGLAELLPHRLLELRGGARGSGLMARLPLRRTGGTPAPAAAEPEAAVELGSRSPHVKVVHPPPPITRGSTREWERLLGAVGGPRAGDGELRLVAGDFNATLDNRALRRLLDRGYVDAADATGMGLRTTYRRRGLGVAIDHVLVPRGVAVRRVSVHRIARSDHRALIAELELPAL